MKIIVFAHHLVVGGTPVNAIDLATALRDRCGHEVVLFATPGPLEPLVHERALRFVPAPLAYAHPSFERMRALRELVARERPALVHAWDWFQGVEAYYGVHLRGRVPLVVTDMMMKVTRVLPRRVPTTFGTREIVQQARAAGRTRVQYLPPPVDVRHNAPGVVDGAAWRRAQGVVADECLLVTVSRLAVSMKSESLLRSIDAVGVLGATRPVSLRIVGGGPMQAALQARADAVNAALGRTAVRLAGEMIDPRPAYAAADIVIGMGGSALRGMAFAKPVIVVGEQGFAAALQPSTAGYFDHHGLYGIGAGGPDPRPLVEQIRDWAAMPAALPEIGRDARRFVERHFGLDELAQRLSGFLEEAVDAVPPPPARLADGLRTAAVYLRERKYLVRSGG